MQVDLYNASNQLIASSNPTSELGAALNLNLSAGDYYVHITGVGQGDPLAVGYTDYGSLGQYTVSGTVDGLVNVSAMAQAAIQSQSSGTVQPGDGGQNAGAIAAESYFVTADDLRFDRAHRLSQPIQHQSASLDSAAHPLAAQALFTIAGEESSSWLPWQTWDDAQTDVLDVDSHLDMAWLSWAND